MKIANDVSTLKKNGILLGELRSVKNTLQTGGKEKASFSIYLIKL
jgi:hypothetical protein